MSRYLVPLIILTGALTALVLAVLWSTRTSPPLEGEALDLSVEKPRSVQPPTSEPVRLPTEAKDGSQAKEQPHQLREPTVSSDWLPPREAQLDTLREMKRLGISHVPELLPYEQDWETLMAMWEDLSRARREARRTFYDIGKRLCREYLESGQYTTYTRETSPYWPGPSSRMPPGEQPPWFRKNHPDDWISVSHNGLVIKAVRIPVGEVPELDAARTAFRQHDEMRKSEIEAFLSEVMARHPHPMEER